MPTLQSKADELQVYVFTLQVWYINHICKVHYAPIPTVQSTAENFQAGACIDPSRRHPSVWDILYKKKSRLQATPQRL